MVRLIISGPGSALAGVIVLCSWARHFTLTVASLRQGVGTQANVTKMIGKKQL